jgi:hypothetical protein
VSMRRFLALRDPCRPPAPSADASPAEVSAESLVRLRDHAAARGLSVSRDHYEALLSGPERELEAGQ